MDRAAEAAEAVKAVVLQHSDLNTKAVEAAQVVPAQVLAQVQFDQDEQVHQKSYSKKGQ
jgi:hypothetical protein